MIFTATGHRPPRLNLSYSDSDRAFLEDFATNVIVTLQELPLQVDKFITGGAAGFDQAVAAACLRLGVPYDVYVPFVGQESKWPIHAQKYYDMLLSHAKYVKFVSEGGYSPYKFIKRDEAMIENCDIAVALFDGVKKGGTYQTVCYANKINREVLNFWDAWVKFKERK